MKKITIINTLLIFLVIIGSFLANVGVIASIIPKNVNKDYDGVKENQAAEIDINILDFKAVTEVFDYLKTQAILNEFDITTTVFSSGLLFETENSLIVIGHGYFDSNDQYRIADYTQNQIKRFSEQKQIVALLGCYSSTIKLDNEIQLTYFDKVDLKTALQDLVNLLDWTISHEFLPSMNIQLFDLDPGGSGNGWSLSNPPPAFNIQRMAYCPEDNIYWNLLTSTGVRSLSTYLLNHKMNAIRFNYIGEFLVETSPNSNSYYIIDQNLQFDAWISNPDGVWDYLNFANTEINGVSKPDFRGSIKVFDIITQLVQANGISYSEAAFNLAFVFTPIGIALCGAAYFIIKYVFAATFSFLIFLGWVGGVIAAIIGVGLVIAAIYYGISGYIRRNE